MMTNEAELRRRAISKALAAGGAKTVTRVRLGTYKVESASRPGTVHTVSVIGANWFCTCEAAAAGRAVCWHRAAVLIAKTEATGVRVVGPAVPPPSLRPQEIRHGRKEEDGETVVSPEAAPPENRYEDGETVVSPEAAPRDMLNEADVWQPVAL